MSRKCKIISIAFFLFMLSSLNILAEDGGFNSLITRGRSSFRSGDYQSALLQLKSAFKLKPSDTEVNFLMGRAAFELNDYETAVMAFDRVLILDPNLPRIKLELGRTYMRLGVLDMAREYFQEVLAENPEQAVRENVEALLLQMDRAQKQHFWNGSLALGVTRDDNARVSPGNDQINTIFGIITLAPNAARELDLYYNATLSLSHLYRFADSPWAWRSSVLNYNSFYQKNGDLDINFFTLQSGPQYRKGKNVYGADLFHSHLLKENSTYMLNYGLNTSWTHALRNDLLFVTGAKVEFKDYRQPPVRTAWNFNLGTGPVFTRGNNTFSLHVGAEHENATIDDETYNRVSGALRYERQLNERWRLNAGYRYQHSRYKDQAALFNARRRDNIHDLSCGVSWRLNQKTSVALNHTWTKSSSTLDLYDYKRNVTVLTVNYNF